MVDKLEACALCSEQLGVVSSFFQLVMQLV